MKYSVPILLVLCVTLSSATAVFAQTWQWEKHQPIWPEGRAGFAWGWDQERNVAVMFGGGGWLETREWDGERWYQPDIMNLPDFPESQYHSTYFHTMTFDPISRQMMLAHYDQPDIRLYDGTTWTNGEPVPLDAGERVREIDGDTFTHKVYALVEELGESSPVGLRIGVWDGSSWTDFPGALPILSQGFMVTNSLNGNILVGGMSVEDIAIALKWTGDSWTEMNPGDPDVGFSFCRGEFDPINNRYIIHSSTGPEYNTYQTLILAGETWTGYSSTGERSNPELIFDPVRNKVLRFGGTTDWYFGSQSSSLYEWSGTEWDEIPTDTYNRVDGTPYYDETDNRMLMLVLKGEYPDFYYGVYEWLNMEWAPVPGTSPLPYPITNPVWDPGTESAVAMKGNKDSPSLETWIWKNGDWTQAIPATSPPPRTSYMTTFDPNLNRMILFGGYIGNFETIWDMWAWDGTNWEQISFNTIPDLGDYGAPYAGSDFHRNRVVMADRYRTDIVWEWDGNDWRSIVPDTAPPYSEENRFFVYVPPMKRLLMVQHKFFYPRNNFGGNDAINIWNGGDWVPLENAFPPLPGTSTSSFQPVWDGENNQLLAYSCNFRGTVPAMACPEPGVSIWMPEHLFQTGDWCSCEVTVCNPDPAIQKNHPLFFVLEVAGTYFFAPSFSDFDHFLGDYPEFSPGETTIQVINSFQWPAGAGTFSGARFIAALTDPSIQVIVGEMDTWEFGWGD